MTLKPLADRVLIKPDPQPTMTASGLHLAEHYKPEQTGTVVAVGLRTHPKREEAIALADLLNGEDECTDPACGSLQCRAAHLLRELSAREPEVAVGDYVLFSWNVGQEIWVNDGVERYLLMRHDDILAVMDLESA